jgi:DNA invertase Pin-like site-specific DNA recombinase
VESGSKNHRPELQKAIAHAKRSAAVLAVAVLDRLSRSSFFINMLLERGVEFVDCQSPHDSAFVVRVKAACAQEELERLRRRTRDALAAYKARGGKLGSAPGTCPIPVEARKQGAKAGGEAAARKAREAYADLLPMIRDWRAAGMTQAQIAERLNAEGHCTSRGGVWHQGHISQLLKRS